MGKSRTMWITVVRARFHQCSIDLLDDKVLDARLDELVKDPGNVAVPTLPAELLLPSSVGQVVRQPAQFPALAACLQDFEPREGEFTPASEIDSAYESVKTILRRNAGAFVSKT
jgi:hypothetical protein